MPAAPTKPAWERYAYASEVEHFEWWCRTHVRQVTDRFKGLPLELERWQTDFLGEALAVGPPDETGYCSRCWQSVLLVVPRKNGKTAMLAAYALYRLLHDDDNPEILLAAASDANAGRLFDAVVAYARANPELERQLHIREYKGEIARADGRPGKIIRLATDPTVLHGYNPSVVICDELHAWTKPSMRKVWTALTTAGGARRDSQVFTITTAGEAQQRKTSILGGMLTRNELAAEVAGTLEKVDALTISRNSAAQTLAYNYCAPTEDPHDLPTMKLANPASWVTLAYLARQAANPELTDAEVLQFHGCVWAAGATSWPPAKAYPDLARPRDVGPEVRVVVSFDGSYSRDSTVLVGATVEEHPYVFLIDAWERPLDLPATTPWRVSKREVMDAIADAFERYDVAEFAPDPPGWGREIEELEQTYGEVVVRFETNQPRRMGPACDDFEQGVLGPGDPEADELGDDPPERGEPELEHDGSDVIERHLMNAVPDSRRGYTLIRKESPDSTKKIDAAVGAVVAYHRARWHWANTEDEDMVAMVVDTKPSTK